MLIEKKNKNPSRKIYPKIFKNESIASRTPVNDTFCKSKTLSFKAAIVKATEEQKIFNLHATKV